MMEIYYGMYLFIGMLSIVSFSKLDKKRQDWIQLYVPMLLMVFLAGFRKQSVGVDTRYYSNLFLSWNWSDLKFSATIVYDVYCCILNQIAGSVTVFHFVNGAIIYYSVMKFIQKYSANYILSYCVFLSMGYFFNSMNQCREYLAIALSLWVFDGMKEECWKRVIIFSLLAVFVHNVSIVLIGVLLVSVFLKKVQMNYACVLIVGGMAAVYVYLNYEEIIYKFTDIFSHYKIYLQDWVGLFEESYNSSARIIYLLLLVLFEIWSVFLFFLEQRILFHKDEEEYYVKKTLLILNAANIFLLLLTAKISLMLRVAMVFEVFLILLLPNFISGYFKQKYTLNTILYFGLAAYMAILMKSDGAGVLPYKFFWSI